MYSVVLYGFRITRTVFWTTYRLSAGLHTPFRRDLRVASHRCVLLHVVNVAGGLDHYFFLALLAGEKLDSGRRGLAD